MAVIFIFIDGIGLGEASNQNPFFVDSYESFQILSGENFSNKGEPVISKDQVFKPIDANLGIEGLPQSGTGQTTLFTGENASKVIGKHFGPYPHSGIKYLLKEQSVFHAVKEAGKKPYFMNAYPPIFFEHAKRRNRWSCTTLMTQSAGMKLNSTEEVLNGEALTAEIVQDAWRERLNIDLPKIDATEAARRLLNVVPDYDLVLYEYYLTDKAGHNQKLENAQTVLKALDEFLLHIIKEKRSEDVLVITSDHGNLEDLSIKTHTRNKVPLFVLGENAESFYGVESLVGVKDSITQLL
ncbi:MAG: alkaline phosphatase family protein [Balneolaceae bacterium]